MENKKHMKYWIYLLSFMLPFSILLFVFFLAKVYPFGDESLLISDMNNQYYSFLSYLRNILLGQKDWIYSLSKGLGDSMSGLNAYYLISPFNIILLFFPTSELTTAIHHIILLKLSCSGLSFSIYLNQTRVANYRSLFISTAYALMAYNLSYFFNVMWFDAVLLLPLIVLGISNIVKKEKVFLYIITLALAMICNYYIAFMICLFAIICIIRSLITAKLEENDNILVMKSIRLFILSSFTAAVLAAVVILPAVFSLAGGKAEGDLTAYLSTLTKRQFLTDLLPTGLDPLRVSAKLYPKALNWQEVQDGSANIYIGLFSLILVILYFLNSKIQKRKKYLNAAILLIFVWSIASPFINMLWHGLANPYWFPYRYSFIISFFMLDLAYDSLLNLEQGIKKRSTLISAGVLCILTFMIYQSADDLFTQKDLIFTLLVLLLITLALTLSLHAHNRSNKISRLILPLLLLLHITDLASNAYASITMLQDASSSNESVKSSYVESLEDTIQSIQTEDPSLFRIEKSFHQSHNDPMLFSYYGLSHYSSSSNANALKFIDDLGFTASRTWAYFGDGSTQAAASLLGIKYLLSKEVLGYETYKPFLKEQDFTVYENPTAFPLMFLIEDEPDIAELERSDIPFDNLDRIFRQINQTNQIDQVSQNNRSTPSDRFLYEEQHYEILIENLHHSMDGDTTIYERLDQEKAAYIHIDYLTSSNPMYVYFTAPRYQDVMLYLNDVELGPYFDHYHWDVRSLGQNKAGQQARLTIEVLQDKLEIDGIYLVDEKLEQLQDIHHAIENQNIDLYEKSSSHLVGTFNYTEDSYKSILLTIPYDAGWTVYIDGTEVATQAYYDALLNIPLDDMVQGTHQIELIYRAKGYKIGLLISMLSLFYLAIVWIFKKLKKKEETGKEIDHAIT